MKSLLIKSISVAAAIITTLSSIAFCVSYAVSWPEINSNKPLKAYTISSDESIPAYSSSSLSHQNGTILSTDEIHVYEISQNGKGEYVAYCSYPIPNGRKIAFIPLSAVTTATAPSETYTSREAVTAYSKANSSSNESNINKGDTVYKLAENGSWTQVIYNIGQASNPSGWRMAWIPSNNYSNSIRPVDRATFPSSPEKISVKKTSGTTAEIKFTAVSGATGYIVYISRDNSNFEICEKTTKTSASVTIKENAVCYFRICAYKTEKDGSESLGNPAKTAAVKFSPYNTAAAVSYAKQHASEGKVLCAEFIADCVAQADIVIPDVRCYKSSTKSLAGNSLGAGTNPRTDSEAQLRWFKDNGFVVIKNPINSQISVGDLVWNTADGDDNVVIITGMSNNGTPLYSSVNTDCDTPLDSARFLVKLS